MTFSEKLKKHLKRHLLFWIVVLFIAVLAGGYLAGYRPGPGLTIVRVGMVSFADLPKGTNVYADQAPHGTAKNGGTLAIDLVPGNHTLIVSAPDMEPWVGIVSVKSNQTADISPIFVPSAPHPKLLSGTDKTDAIKAFGSVTVPSEAAPLRMGCTDVYVSGNRVVTAPATTTPDCTAPDYLCSEGSCAPTISYAPTAPVRSVIPFPNRTDAVIIATGEWVYAISLDPRSPQFFAPVLQGTLPTLAPVSTTTFNVSDAGSYYSVTFE
jgi:hypothetical protein